MPAGRPRLWNKLLRKVIKELGLWALQSDPQLFVWHVHCNPKGFAPHALRTVAGQKRPVLILSKHVDDLKAQARLNTVVG